MVTSNLPPVGDHYQQDGEAVMAKGSGSLEITVIGSLNPLDIEGRMSALAGDLRSFVDAWLEERRKEDKRRSAR